MPLENNSFRVGVFFDLDLTITNRDSFLLFLKKHYLHDSRNWHLIPRILVWGIMRKLRLIPLLTFKSKALGFLNGKTKEEIREIGDSFFQQQVASIVRERAVERISWHREKGHLIFLLTSCPDIYIHKFSEYFNATGYECTRLIFLGNKFAGKLDSPDCFGKEKAKNIASIAESYDLDLRASYAYSDHESDLPMMKIVGTAVAVTPTPILRKTAEKNGWHIEQW